LGVVPEIAMVDLAAVVAVHGDLCEWSAAEPDADPMGPWTAAAADGWSTTLGSVENAVGFGALGTVADTAAALLVRGATTQYLIDGNKRLALALAVAEVQVALNGYRISVDADDLITFAMLVANCRAENVDVVQLVVAEYLDRHIELLT